MEDKTKVLHVGLSNNIGGIETVVRSWHKVLPSDISFDFINNGEGSLAFEKEFLESGSRILTIPSRKTNPSESFNALNRIVNEGEYDYLHFHAMSLSWPEPVLIAAKSKYTQAIIHSHTVLDSNISLKYKILHSIGKLRLKNKNYYRIACGENAGKSMFKSNDFIIIPNGIELDKYRYSQDKRSRVRKDFGISSDAFVIGHVGRPGPTKNYPLIFEAFDESMKRYDNSFLLLIGNIEKDAEIQSLLEKTKYRERVVFTGFQRDCSEFYSAMDVFFFPSLYEGFSVSLVEAQASGLPCVVGNVAKESKMSDNFSFVDIKTKEDAVNEFSKYLSMNLDRRNVEIDPIYDIRNTSKMLFDFYRTHKK